MLLCVAAFYHHQLTLKERARVMREAMRNRDFTFRLPSKGLLFGERALQEGLNDFGVEVQRLVAQNEVESWQRLTRVLTHEIMNAIAPISSISQAYLSMPQIKDTTFEEGIKAIRDTSQSLSTFVASYRKLTQLQKPVKEKFLLREWMESIVSLYREQHFDIDIPTGLVVSTDRSLLRQVVVNLLKNAQEAGARKIDIRWRDALLISNDGAPIPPDVRQDIFVPFFTTKQSSTGIGLSLSRQIMLMQGADLKMSERPITGFTVTFEIVPEPQHNH